MNAKTLSPIEIRRVGLAALARDLGFVGMVRFLQQFESGAGDYSTERHAWLGAATVSDWATRIRQRREAPATQIEEP
jgi:hypothetical protein